ncbi:thioredoxin domain-containing protein [Hufsiella ginkgonis]|uniref:DUF255 domain-containing protein n=1 Tax=Hufsiella ginkgonis TaxID=2695274 RepID=A0A7K1XYE7_9SPHI|nr:thioredoxin domain-containing protein [Hufsiella ginkgonis]MXV15566.1 DUF255 domain-containing protein [Hufsiella ginkgonis]
MPNKLIGETSPYLQQHAHNPVNWYPWGDEALDLAVKENKLILVSIGYSACHWCHVMEHESFEDESVAAIMNAHFVCIKIDREERPDIDQVYMYAVQLMTGGGGWPLNCFCLPDQRPVYGGTYFRNGDWKNLLLNLSAFWRDRPAEAVEYAERLTEGIRNSEIPGIAEPVDLYTTRHLEDIFTPWKRYFDTTAGGYNRAPKFPLPNNWQFMFRYAWLMEDDAANLVARLTLEKMAYGGIYDHIGGGFARYSVDGEWHVPHFEKMLYDNAQLVSLYAEGYRYCGDPLYKQVVFETLDWLEREMTSPEGGFYSALDADSEGTEGKFYTFTRSELQELLGGDEPVFSTYFNVTETGNWQEEHTNIFKRKEDDSAVAHKLGMPETEMLKILARAKDKVARYRDTRIRPGLDNKILASWNGLMIRGLVDAYDAFAERPFLDSALKNARFVKEHLVLPDNSIKRLYQASPGEGWNGAGFLDDYAFIIDGFIALYEATFDENWLSDARKLADYAIAHFFDRQSGLFFYTSAGDKALIARKLEIMDNVIPSSNSMMAHNLYRLGHLFNDDKYVATARQMLANVFPHIKGYGSSYSNWAGLLLFEVFGLYEIAITGQGSMEKRQELATHYVPNKILFGGKTGTLPLLADKWLPETKIFVCKNRTCQLPVSEVAEALEQISDQ